MAAKKKKPAAKKSPAKKKPAAKKATAAKKKPAAAKKKRKPMSAEVKADLAARKKAKGGAYSTTAKRTTTAKRGGASAGYVSPASLNARLSKVEAVQREQGKTLKAHAEVLDMHSTELEVQGSILDGLTGLVGGGGRAAGARQAPRQTARDTIEMAQFPN